MVTRTWLNKPSWELEIFTKRKHNYSLHARINVTMMHRKCKELLKWWGENKSNGTRLIKGHLYEDALMYFKIFLLFFLLFCYSWCLAYFLSFAYYVKYFTPAQPSFLNSCLNFFLFHHSRNILIHMNAPQLPLLAYLLSARRGSRNTIWLQNTVTCHVFWSQVSVQDQWKILYTT